MRPCRNACVGVKDTPVQKGINIKTTHKDEGLKTKGEMKAMSEEEEEEGAAWSTERRGAHHH